MSSENSEAGPAANGTGQEIAGQQQTDRTQQCALHPPGTRRIEDPVTGADLGACPQCHPRFASSRVRRNPGSPRPRYDVDQAVAGADSWYKSCFEQALTEAIRRGRTFGADDLVDLGLPEPDSPNRIGALLNRATQLGRIERVGDRPSRNPSAHGRRIGLYLGRRGA